MVSVGKPLGHMKCSIQLRVVIFSYGFTSHTIHRAIYLYGRKTITTQIQQKEIVASKYHGEYKTL